jgi:hypothetical protein
MSQGFRIVLFNYLEGLPCLGVIIQTVFDHLLLRMEAGWRSAWDKGVVLSRTREVGLLDL